MKVPARISLVTLGVSDLGRSIEFYEALGWEKSPASIDGEIAWFKTAGTVLGLFGRTALAEDAALPPGEPQPYQGFTLAINVEEHEHVAAMLDAAVAAGATLLKPATKADWGGTSGYFADPDGHPWEIACNPSFPIGEDGLLRMP
jgi:uncharacterized protein